MRLLFPNCEILDAALTLSGPLAANVIAEDETLALFTLEMILTVERNIHQPASSIDRRWANQCLHD